MMKGILLAVSAIVGFVLGVGAFLVIDFPLHPPFAVVEPTAWSQYGSLIFGGVGACCGVVLGWAACVWIKKRQMRRAHVRPECYCGRRRSVA